MQTTKQKTQQRPATKNDVNILVSIIAHLVVELDEARAELAELKGVKPEPSIREWLKILCS